ncbi:unnamed protein product [Parnassius mnemosyne]|uniref:C2 domain-containing protein n=1 Tax=Parnassius mnemosyne TaxID=213953 RepID=A0AAV1M222_9NEOP
MSSFYDFTNFRRSTDNINGGIERQQNRQKPLKLWRSSSLVNIVGNSNKKSPVYESSPITERFRKYGSTESLNTLDGFKNRKQIWRLKEFESANWDTIVTIVLVAAKGLPLPPNDGAGHELYCKFRLGPETFKSKSVIHSRQPEWRERFNLHLYKDNLLKLSLWDKGRQKNFMGSCVLDLSTIEKERTHEIWQQLDDGYGFIHLSLTMCVVRYVPAQHRETIKTDDLQHKDQNTLDLKSDWKLVGSLHVKVIKAKGLSGKSSAYCKLELNNERLRTHRTSSSFEPMWNKSYVLDVYDVTSELKITVLGSSLRNALLNEFLGQVSIPLLRINNGEARWYALKGRNKRNAARGNCPRILLQMNINWNPIKATLRLFRPKEVKHIQKPYKMDISILLKNLVTFSDWYNKLLSVNEKFKSLFEWDNRELSALALLVWLIFCYHLKPWAVPLILLLPFLFFWSYTWIQGDSFDNDTENNEGTHDSRKDNKGLGDKINNMQDVTTTVSFALDIGVSVVERIINLITFKVPFLSYVAMSLLVIVSVMLYFMPFNYLLMLFGIYKFMRKYLNPDRMLNNDLIDFISRIPDNKLLKDWKELNVPEPTP